MTLVLKGQHRSFSSELKFVAIFPRFLFSFCGEKNVYIYIHGRWSDKDENIYRPSVVYSFLIDDGRGKKTFRKKTSARQESKTGRIFYGSEDPRMGNDNNYSHAKETIYRVASVNYVNAIFRYNPCRFLFDRSKRSSIPNSKETITTRKIIFQLLFLSKLYLIRFGKELLLYFNSFFP